MLELASEGNYVCKKESIVNVCFGMCVTRGDTPRGNLNLY